MSKIALPHDSETRVAVPPCVPSARQPPLSPAPRFARRPPPPPDPGFARRPPPPYVKTSFLHNRHDRNTQENLTILLL